MCVICCEDIKYFGINFPCGHNQICWNCCLKQKLKIANDVCPVCNQKIAKVLISNRPDSTLTD